MVASEGRQQLTGNVVLRVGGWHPRYARVVALAQDGDYGLVLVDGNGNGQELEAEFFFRTDEGWTGGTSWGVGPLDSLPNQVFASWPSHAVYGYGAAAGEDTVTVVFDDQQHQVPVSSLGVWIFIKRLEGRLSDVLPHLRS